jgi:hypothetical protein
MDRQRIGQGLGVRATRDTFGVNRGLQDQRNMLEQGIAGVEVRHYCDAIDLQ